MRIQEFADSYDSRGNILEKKTYAFDLGTLGTVESLQGFCYIENLTLQNCRLPNTSLAFEYCTVDAEVKGHVDSILNPISGKITVGSVGELLLEPDKIDPKATEIVITGEI